MQMEISTFFDFCSGIGGGRLGLETVGLSCVGRSDTSRLSDSTYKLMFNVQSEKNFGNLKKIDCNQLPDFDVLIAGFPCQSFSIIGRRDGFDDQRGQIIFHLARIIDKKQPKAFILENVRGLVSHNKGETLKTILTRLNLAGYNVHYRVLTSLDFGVPQMRQRIYFVGIRKDYLGIFQWPNILPKASLKEFLVDSNKASEERLAILKNYLKTETNGGKYTIEDLKKMEGKILDTRMSDLRIYEGRCPTLRSHRDGILYIRNGIIYQLTGFEALLLQGFPKEKALKVKHIVTDRHLLMQAGNAMTVNVIACIGESLVNFFKSI